MKNIIRVAEKEIKERRKRTKKIIKELKIE